MNRCGRLPKFAFRSCWETIQLCFSPFANLLLIHSSLSFKISHAGDIRMTIFDKHNSLPWQAPQTLRRDCGRRSSSPTN
jgi:hypothetical protein